MPYVKYTREVLLEAIAASTSMAGVLRHLGLRPNGGIHAHLRRRMDRLGLDTSHFLGQAHSRGVPSPRRKAAAEILTVRGELDKRVPATTLTRALIEVGRAHRCADCGVGAVWNGRPLTLHVDHIDGRFCDNRPANLRFMCPNCHSQTATYAGRNRRAGEGPLVHVDTDGNTVPAVSARPLSEQQQIELLIRTENKQVSVAEAARMIGCSAGHIYQLRRRLAERGTLQPARRRSAVDRTAVVAFAVAHPGLGPRKLSEELRKRRPHPIRIAHGSISTILRDAGLRTVQARAAAAGLHSCHDEP